MRFAVLAMASVATAAMLGAGEAKAGATLDGVKAKGFVQCGVNSVGLPGFAEVDSANNWSGLDIDLCRAVAAALFGDATKVEVLAAQCQGAVHCVPVGRDRCALAQHHMVQLARQRLGLTFAGANYYDGQGFMAKK